MPEIPRQTGYFESFDGTPIYFESRGSGPAMILCYGIVCTMNHWHYQLRHFSRVGRVITFDYRGHHRSARPRDLSKLNLDSLALDVLSLVKHLELPPSSFWGHSFGAQVLVRALDIKPELFHNVVLINGFASNPLTQTFTAESLARALGLAKQAYDRLPATLDYIWKFAANNPASMRLSALAGGFNLDLTSMKDVEIYARGVANVDLEVFLTLFQDMLHYDGRTTLNRIAAPALIIGGSLDRVTPLTFQETLHRDIPNSDLQIVPMGTHCSQLDMPDLVNLSIEKFLRRVAYLNV